MKTSRRFKLVKELWSLFGVVASIGMVYLARKLGLGNDSSPAGIWLYWMEMIGIIVVVQLVLFPWLFNLLKIAVAKRMARKMARKMRAMSSS